MIKKAVSVLLIVFAIGWSFSALLPNKISSIDAPDNIFTTQRALIHLKEISKNAHYIGSEAHNHVRTYIVNELQKLGLETEIQEGYAIGDWGNLSKAKNIVARIKGTESDKALLLLSHYDSHPHSSKGASDAGSGVVTILEGVRAFLNKNKTPKNDIIILISDGEELGLNGADIFVNQHEWAKNVGLVLNFEARGSGGPSIMLIETNQGNANLMKGFVKANPEFPVGNSLFYSIYKMLPNDTDLTRFREDADIDGFNFAFIDDHFDYHTALDTYERLDRKTLEHQGSYLMPLLNYFSEANLDNLKSTEDYIYFNVPLFKTVIYPFSWAIPMIIIAILIFIVLFVYGLKKRAIELKFIMQGFAAFLSAIMISGLIGFLGWKLLNVLYPEYAEILHGFTYNGHTYIAAFTCLALAVCFFAYSKVYKPENTASLLIAPLFLWLVICAFIAINLIGASFFIIPVLFTLIAFFVLLRQKKPSLIILTLLGFPALLIFSPLVQMFPVGLGLKIVLVSTILVTLIFGLLISVFGFFRHKKRWSYVFLFFSFWFLISAHINSNFTKDTPKPNSLLYILNADDNTAKWVTYDNILDPWNTPFLSETPNDASSSNLSTISSKYNTAFSFSKSTKVINLNPPQIETSLDTIIGNNRHVEICITSNRSVNRIEVFTDKKTSFKSLKANGITVFKNEKALKYRRKKRLFTYYVTDNEPLEISLVLDKNDKMIFEIYEASYDLLDNQLLNVPKRKNDMIPKPFVLNDAIVIKKSIIVN
ncbi:MAG: M28 family peptidase [Algibacter sp.]